MAPLSRVDRGVVATMSPNLGDCLFHFIHHHGLEKVSEIISSLGGCTTDETREAFVKMVGDFNSKPLEVDDDEDEDEDQDHDLEDEDMDEGEDGDKADGKACKLFGGTKRSSLVKRLDAPIGDELEPKKPRIAEISCVQVDKTEATTGIKNSSP